MKEINQEAEQVMIERFGKDTIISLATTENATPYVRKWGILCHYPCTIK